VDKLAFSENVPEQSLRNLFTWPDATASDYYIPLKDVIDINKEKERILKTKEKLLNDLKNLQNKLNNQDFVSRAPKHEIERITSYLELTKNKLAKTDELYNQL